VTRGLTSFEVAEGASVGVAEAIREAETLLPGVPVEEGQDPRWGAIIAVGEFIESEPDAVWGFVRRWGGHPQEDLRDAVATCLLEHLLEHHFAAYFPLVEQHALADPLFGDTFQRCWQFGQALEPGNAGQFAGLFKRLMPARPA
jgi:hypothetical protein